MVLKTLPYGVVCSETLLSAVVVMAQGPSAPSMALYTKVVVAMRGEVTLACPTLKQALGQGYGCGNAIPHHFFNGDVFVSVDIGLIVSIPSHLLCACCQCTEKTANH